MLAATPKLENNALDLIRLALSMVESGEANIPQSLKEYFSEVLKQAKTIVEDPPAELKSVRPEAIELAIELRAVAELLDNFDKIDSIDCITPPLAKEILMNMEVHSVHQDGFSAFASIAN